MYVQKNTNDEDEADWDIMLMQLEQFKVQFGNKQVPEPTNEEEQAGWYEVFVWFKKQLEKQKKGTLRSDLDQKLKKLSSSMKPIHVHVPYKSPSKKKKQARYIPLYL